VPNPVFPSHDRRGLVNGEKTLTLKLKPTSEDLDTPLQTNLFPSSELSDTGLGTVTYYAVQDQARPLGYGTIRNAEGMLVKRSTNEYHLHDEDAFSILGVYDRGVSVSYTHHNKGFTLAADPDGRVVADFRGQETADDTSFLKNINEIVADIMSRMSVTAYSSTDLSTINTELGYNYNYYQDNKVNRTAKEVVQWLCDSHTGWFYTDADGDIRFGYLDEPAVTADVEINRYQITDEVDKVDDLGPNLTARLGGNRNWYIYHPDDMAASATDEDVMDRTTQWQDVVTGVNTIDSFYNEANVIHDTLIQNTTKIQEEADRITDLYSQKRAFYFFSSVVNAEIGETVEVTYPRHGLSAGVNLLCVGREIDFINNTYRLT